MELYHNVLNLKILKLILNNNVILKDKKIIKPCVYLTRDFYYLMERGIRMVFDYDKLKYNYKVSPFCLKGYNLLNNINFTPKRDEMEERVYNDINIMKCLIIIDIDKNKYDDINLCHPLINHTPFFNCKRNILKKNL
jgi:hypothetical protein